MSRILQLLRPCTDNLFQNTIWGVWHFFNIFYLALEGAESTAQGQVGQVLSLVNPEGKPPSNVILQDVLTAIGATLFLVPGPSQAIGAFALAGTQVRYQSYFIS